jgi:hypothetical protein
MIRWAALILASLSWLFAFQLFVVPVPAWQWTFIAAGWLLGTVGLRRFAGRVRLSPNALLLLVPLAVIIGLADAPYRPGAWLLAVGLILSVIGRSRAAEWLQPAGLASLLLGTVLVIQSPCAFAVQALTARYQEVPLLGAVVYTVLSWLGCDVSYSAGTFYYRTMRDVYPFPLTWNHVDLMSLLPLWIALLLAVQWGAGGRRGLVSLVRVSWILLAYAVGRLVVMILIFGSAMIFVEHEQDIVHVEVFWMPWITFLSWLPLIAVLAGLAPWRTRSGAAALSAGRWDRAGWRGLGLAAGCAACAGAVIAVYFPDPGQPKNGRILLDESHSQWERTDNEYNTDWYGHESGYNYYCMAQYLDRFYDLDFNMAGNLTPQKLADYDVLILKTPTEPYGDDEIRAIEDFVRRGGGLFALGEHTNVFGSSTFLNPVVRRFGMIFRYDVVFDIERKWEQVHFPGQRLVRDALSADEPPKAGEPAQPGTPAAAPSGGGGAKTLRARQRLVDYITEMIPAAVQNQMAVLEKRYEDIGKAIDRRTQPRLVQTSRLGVHPIVQWMPFDRFAVSCSIASNWACRSVIRSTGLWTLPIDYTAGNFYPTVEDKSYARFGAFDQMVAAQVGAGRVVAFGDSTVYSNFLAFYPGKAEKLLGAVDWLNRRNRLTDVPRLGAGLFVVGLLGVLVLRVTLLRPHLGYSAALASCAAACVWLALWACTAAARKWYPPPTPHEPVHTVVFDMEHSDCKLPIFGFTQGSDYAKSYEIFYQWILRLGFFTDARFDLEAALRGPGPIVIVRPRGELSRETVAALNGYLERGGSMLVLDTPNNQDQAYNWLSALGLSFTGQRCRGTSIVEPSTGARICGLQGGMVVSGGLALLTTDAGETVAAFKQVGQGSIIAAGLAERFADTQMGMSSRAVPNREVRAAYELGFALIRGLVQGDVASQVAQVGEIYKPATSAPPTAPPAPESPASPTSAPTAQPGEPAAAPTSSGQ